MSQNKTPDQHDDISPDMNGTLANDDKNQKEDLEWTYSGKAMRAQFILYCIISLLLIGGGVYATVFANLVPADSFKWTWIGVAVLVALLWIQFFTVYFYRTWTIRYKLTDQRLYTYKGLLTKTSDSMELIFIEDLQLVQTLWDRLFNGGVGKIVIHSSADKTDAVLNIKGIDRPAYVFERLDSIRTELRKRRAMLQASG